MGKEVPSRLRNTNVSRAPTQPCHVQHKGAALKLCCVTPIQEPLALLNPAEVSQADLTQGVNHTCSPQEAFLAAVVSAASSHFLLLHNSTALQTVIPSILDLGGRVPLGYGS